MPMTETRFTCSEVGRKHLLPIGAFRSAERGKMEQSGFIQLFSRRSHNGKNPWKIGWLLCAGWAGHSHRAEVWKTLSHNKGEGHSPIPALGESPLRFMFDRSGRKMLRRVVFRDYFSCRANAVLSKLGVERCLFHIQKCAALYRQVRGLGFVP